MPLKLLLVLVGGGLGSMTRYLTSLAGARLFGTGFPAGTLAVNLAGCLLIGVAFAVVEERGSLGPGARLLIMTGFLGGLTTFSTFALESVTYGQAGSLAVSFANVAVNNLGGFAMVLAGLWLGRAL